MTVLDRLRGGLIVSVQAEPGSLLATPETLALLARVAAKNGAAGVRAEGVATLCAVRRAVDVPIIGILKRAYDGFAPYITSTVADVREVLATDVDIVAFDATQRPRADGATVVQLCREIRTAGRLAMGDCSTVADARDAAAAGCDILGTTLAGYTDETRNRSLPALDVVEALATEHSFVVCEGGVASPDAVAAAVAAGASAVVVGTAITNVDALVRRFIPKGRTR